MLWAGTQGPQARSEGTGHRHRPAASGPPAPPSHLPARRFLYTQSPWALLWGERGGGEQSGGAGERGNARSSTPPPAQQDLTPGWGLCPSPPTPPQPQVGLEMCDQPCGLLPSKPQLSEPGRGRGGGGRGSQCWAGPQRRAAAPPLPPFSRQGLGAPGGDDEKLSGEEAGRKREKGGITKLQPRIPTPAPGSGGEAGGRQGGRGLGLAPGRASRRPRGAGAPRYLAASQSLSVANVQVDRFGLSPRGG